MAQVLVRNLDGKTVRALKGRAQRHRRSLQQELKSILQQAGREQTVDYVAAARRIYAKLARSGRRFGDSGREQAEDRLR